MKETLIKRQYNFETSTDNFDFYFNNFFLAFVILTSRHLKCSRHINLEGGVGRWKYQVLPKGQAADLSFL